MRSNQPVECFCNPLPRVAKSLFIARVTEQGYSLENVINRVAYFEHLHIIYRVFAFAI